MVPQPPYLLNEHDELKPLDYVLPGLDPERSSLRTSTPLPLPNQKQLPAGRRG